MTDNPNGDDVRDRVSTGYLERYVVKEGGGGHAHLLHSDARSTLCGLEAEGLQARRHGEPVCQRCHEAANRIDAKYQEAPNG